VDKRANISLAYTILIADTLVYRPTVEAPDPLCVQYTRMYLLLK